MIAAMIRPRLGYSAKRLPFKNLIYSFQMRKLSFIHRHGKIAWVGRL